ncbi:NTP transferase domain-containing protein [Pseudoruegeria sp. SK021]|uniref:nucleotidyltransferase family protein n=1 Tax=Pseudoruegeria sp. SK021 TaxID=1933035 RepID=UPI000A26348A|nr:nucleotidyltransferase family protein [Pseudoruegeria sp. SK021]OSP55993.1 hypothetical protein BV911_04930 [Pseudoruegeria sp. SK021]
MIRVGLVLAAGQSWRFGSENKLLQLYNGLPLADHVADTFRAVPLDHRIVVVSDPQVAALFDGFDVVHLDDGTSEQSRSLRHGVRHAVHRGAERLLIGLADMPLVDAGTLTQILTGCTDTTASCARGVAGPMPPACFPTAMLSDLMTLKGDRGAGALLRDIPVAAQVLVPPDRLRDVDTPADLAGLDQPGSKT